MTSLHYIVAALPAILFLLAWKLFREDTFPESHFFVVDQARTLRFFAGYLLLMEFFVFGFGLLFPFLLAGIYFLILGVLWFVLNLLIGIFIIVTLIFGGSGAQLVLIGEIGNFMFFKGIMDLLDNSSTYIVWGFLLLALHIIIAPPLIGRQTGAYLEDYKATRLMIFMLIIFETTVFLFFYSVGYISIIDQYTENYGIVIILTLIAVRVLLIMHFNGSAYSNKNKKEYFDLPEVGKIRKAIIFIFGFPGMVLFALGLNEPIINDSRLINQFTSNYDLYAGLMSFTSFSIFILLFFPVIFYFRGDFPLFAKIQELELREDLRQQAEEFKNLNDENIEEFARKNPTRI